MFQFRYLLSRALGGYIFTIPELIGYFLLLHALRRKQKPLHILSVFVFAFYLLLVIAATGIGSTPSASFSPEFQLLPLRDLFTAPMHVFLNIVALIPLGLLLPLLYPRCRNIQFVSIVGCLFSLCIELVQMFGWGVTEIDDLLANTLGVCFGYWIYCLIQKPLPQDFCHRFQATGVSGLAEFAVLSVSSFLIMILA